MNQQFKNPSRSDAVGLTRQEKTSLMFLMNLVSSLIFAKEDLSDRLNMIENGHELMDMISDGSMKLLTEIRMTIPEKQRASISNVAKDYEMRLVPKMTPSKISVVVDKEDFRCLVDAAQVKCQDCTELNEDCWKCNLFQLLQNVIPLEAYDTTFLCPYNRAEWEN